MRQPLRATLLFVAGLLMGFAAVVNAAIAVPHFRGDMVEIHVRPTLLGAVSLGLHFGTFAMFGFALVVLAAAVQASQGATPSRPLLAIIAAVYVTFGLAAFFLPAGERTFARLRPHGCAHRSRSRASRFPGFIAPRPAALP